MVCGYVRPEANFSSLEALIQRIHKDGDVSKAALSHPKLAGYAKDGFLQPTAAEAANVLADAAGINRVEAALGAAAETVAVAAGSAV